MSELNDAIERVEKLSPVKGDVVILWVNRINEVSGAFTYELQKRLPGVICVQVSNNVPGIQHLPRALAKQMLERILAQEDVPDADSVSTG